MIIVCIYNSLRNGKKYDLWGAEESLIEGYKVGGDLNKFVLFDVGVILSRPLCCRPMGEAEPSPGDSQWDGKALLFWSESEC